jgi:hypothetical protein
MKKIAALLLLVSGVAGAGDANLSWTHPTTYTDGTALPISQIARTEVEYGLCNAGRTGFLASPVPVIVTVAPPPATRVVTGLAPGTWCFRARTVATTSTTPSAWTVNTDGTLASKVILQAPPSAPTNLTIASADLSVYVVLKRVNRFVMVKVGTAPAGTPCIADQTVNGYFAVPREVVQWAGTVREDVVVASCA